MVPLRFTSWEMNALWKSFEWENKVRKQLKTQGIFLIKVIKNLNL